ncbi:HAPLN3 [Branchiostoma lanceolatum]|uniref:HAPLN3 protein n=1 Tax=Branchiostoma lanceolatum TaxID=7740 RepID=A0A8J9ZEH3_BRALA|nr:HAPLN3 [Branchiostoma lanceolatum]
MNSKYSGITTVPPERVRVPSEADEPSGCEFRAKPRRDESSGCERFQRCRGRSRRTAESNSPVTRSLAQLLSKQRSCSSGKMKLFCTASLCLMMLGLLAHGSSGDEMDGSIGEEQGAYPGNEMDGDAFPGSNGEEEDAYPGDDESPAGSYKYDLDEAKHACEQEGATLASYHQLYEAWQDGLQRCACAWLSDGTARYPMQKTHEGCGKSGINKCGWQSSWNAWCFRPLSICG